VTEAAALSAKGVSKAFAARGAPAVAALQEIDLEIPAGTLACVVGPDGAGKTTFLRLAAGLLTVDAGELTVLGLDVRARPQAVQDRISYMPQRFGLYEDLSVQENLDLYADLHGVTGDARRRHHERLMEMTDLGRFTDRPAGKLSGGMKQKLGLACTLVRSPQLLLLDEPTVGVDPLSRRELWEIVHQLVDEEHLTVLVTTAYLDEAEACQQVFVLDRGRLLASGPPASLRERADRHVFLVEPPRGEPARALQSKLLDDTDRVVDAVPQAGEVRVVLRSDGKEPGASDLLPDAQPTQARLEDGFMLLLRERTGSGASRRPASAAAAKPQGHEVVIDVHDLVKRFGDFTAVANTSFDVRKGEIFGLLGPNGAGKTTTFRMLCGLLPPTSGELRVVGVDLRRAPARARQRIGYVSQRFALYRNLTVAENLAFFGNAYGLHGTRLARRCEQMLDEFDLGAMQERASGELPGGYKQRLAMATALLHQPEVLFLDEPTSGADPLARREFWRRITELAAAGVTLVVTTHFMEEAEYCDRILIQDAGRVLALGTPKQVREQAGIARRAPMEQAFIEIVRKSRASGARA
jgi:ABC-2 type transport system ATP-binding protein